MREFDRLVEIMQVLRAPGGCPWDARQDHASIARCVVEEAYELVEAIEEGDVEHMMEELGDVLLQVVFHGVIARDLGEFTVQDVIERLISKLVERHPHVFGDATAATAADVVRNWERIKESDPRRPRRVSVLDGIPKGLPPVIKARRLQSAASRVGFDWKDPRDVVKKIQEEIREFEDALESGDTRRVKDEVGDLLFSVVNLARLCRVDPDSALAGSNRKFSARFHAIEKKAEASGKTLADMTLEEMDRIWESTKTERP